MRFRASRRSPGRSVRRERHGVRWGRWIVVAVGLGVLVASLVAAAGPFRQSREFRQTVACERSDADCFGRETGSIVHRRTWTTTTTHTDANGHTYTTTQTHYEVTWERAAGHRSAREVSPAFYRRAREGQPADLRTWRDEVVGVEVMGGEQWFLPSSGEKLGGWLFLAWFGLGIVLWGAFLGWWDGLFMLVFRTFVWMFMAFMIVSFTTDAVAYGFDTGWELVGDLVLLAFFTAIPAGMLVGSLDTW